jgi:hypothetical protein
MRVRVALLSALVLIGFVVSGCGIANSLMGKNAGTVSDLWSDVPPLDGASKVNLDIPLPMQLIIQGFVQAANADNSNDTKLDKFDFIAYQTSMSPQQVAQFYTLDKMKAAGWNSEDTPGCTAGTDTSGTTSGAAGFCAFGKKDNAGKATVLLIIPFQDSQTNQTQVFYVRFEGTKKTQ